MAANATVANVSATSATSDLSHIWAQQCKITQFRTQHTANRVFKHSCVHRNTYTSIAALKAFSGLDQQRNKNLYLLIEFYLQLPEVLVVAPAAFFLRAVSGCIFCLMYLLCSVLLQSCGLASASSALSTWGLQRLVHKGVWGWWALVGPCLWAT